MDEILNSQEVKEEIEEYEAFLAEKVNEEKSDTTVLKLARQRNSRRRAAAKNGNFEEKKAARKVARVEKNTDPHGHCPMKPKQVAYFKTARRRAERREANKLAEQE